jgi:hypothetical protein
MRALLLLGPVFFVLAMSLGRSQNPDDDRLDDQLMRLRNVNAALQLKNASSDSPQAQAMASKGQVISGYLSDVSSFQQQGNYEQIIRSGRRLLRQDLPPEIKSALTDLLASIEKLRDAKMKEVADKGEALLKNVADICWKAQDVKELDPLQDDVQDLREKVQSGGSRLARKWQNRLSQVDNFLSRWGDYMAASAEGDAKMQFEILRDLRRESGYRFIVSRLPADELKKKQAALQAALAQTLNKRLNDAQSALLQAKTEDQVDKVSDDISEIQNENDSNITGQKFNNRLNRLQNATQYWSQVLFNEANGEYDQALQALRNLMNNSQDIQFPHDMLNATLTRLLQASVQAPIKSNGNAVITLVNEQMDRMKTPAQLEQTLKLVETVRQYSSSDNQSLNLLENDLQSLATVQEALSDKRYGTVFDPPQAQRNYPWHSQVDALRSHLVIQALNELYGAPDPAQFKGTTVEAFDAAFKGATAKNDWPQALEILENKDRFINGTCGRTNRPADIAAIRAYVEGVNLEQAEQWHDAVLAFRGVLRQNTPWVPRAQALEHLQKIGKDHPEAAVEK